MTLRPRLPHGCALLDVGNHITLMGTDKLRQHGESLTKAEKYEVRP